VRAVESAKCRLAPTEIIPAGRLCTIPVTINAPSNRRMKLAKRGRLSGHYWRP